MPNKQIVIKDEKILKDLGLEKNKSQKYRLNSYLYSKWLTLKESTESVDNSSETSDNDYKREPFVLSAWDESKGKILSIEEYCEKYNLDFDKVGSWKFLPHHYSVPAYNIVFKKQIAEDLVDVEKIKEILKRETEQVFVYKNYPTSNDREGVLKWADLHFGALIKNLVKTRDFDTKILRRGLMESVRDLNSLNFAKTHVHIQGDLIESFTGLNHINSWQSMDPEMIGAKVIKMCSKLLHDALSQINNLGTIKITGGNHDRLTSRNDEDVKSGAADIIGFCLELMGYDVEFHPYVITHEVQGINYINLHGDKKLTSKTSEEIASLYGVPGAYNFITEAHLHTAMEKLTATQRMKFKVIKDDKLSLRRLVLKPFFTGNYYSETLGYNTNAGYSIWWANEHGLPKCLDNTI